MNSDLKKLHESEVEKYSETWDNPNYRRYSPAERRHEDITEFLFGLDDPPCQYVLDVGTGTGRLALRLQRIGFDVTPLDIAPNCMDPEPAEEFKDRLILKNIDDPDLELGMWDAIVCIDVLEHLHYETIDYALENIRKTAAHGFLVPACFASGYHLHPIVENSHWWARKISEHIPEAEFVHEPQYCVARY